MLESDALKFYSQVFGGYKTLDVLKCAREPPRRTLYCSTKRESMTKRKPNSRLFSLPGTTPPDILTLLVVRILIVGK